MGRLTGPKGPHSNRVDETVEEAILDYSLSFSPIGVFAWRSKVTRVSIPGTLEMGVTCSRDIDPLTI
ncbi:hypothetical protein JCM12178A_33100 [Salidesulfovibrio brasiliensis]